MKIQALSGRNVWITGASSGIGLEMSLLAAEAGAHLTLFSSRREALAEAARLCQVKGAASVFFEAVDLSEAESAAAVSRKVLESSGTPDYLILNAGISQRSPAALTDMAVVRKIMNLNFFAAVAMTREVLPSMAEKGFGRIGVTSSLTGVFGYPLRSAYAASKHALHGYFESVALEYASSGIKTTLAVLGPINTPISLNSLTGDGGRHGKMDANQEKGMDARICAEKYWNAVIRGRWETVIGGFKTIMLFFYRNLPFLYRFIGKRISPTGNRRP